MEMKDLFKQHTDAVEARLDELGVDTKVLKAQLFELEQKGARRGLGGDEPTSWGQQFVQSDGLKNFAGHRSSPGRFRMDVKTTITSGSALGGPLAPTRTETDPTMLPRRIPRVRDLLTAVSIETGVVEYPRQTGRTNNAANVAEGALKPESALAFEMASVTARTIAHWIPASVQILEDAPQLAGIIDSELRLGLTLVEDLQLLYGSGTGENLTGLAPLATAYSAPFTVAGGMIDQVALAMLQGALADYSPSGIVMHPSDWMRIRLLKDGQGKYLLGEPGAQVEPRLFGLPVVPTTAMTIDKFLVGDFPAAATLYDRWEPRVEVSTEHADFFTRNLVAIRAEERLALAVKQPGALIYGDFGNVA